MTRRVEYTPDSIQRALDHHVTTGALSSATRSGEALRPAWTVEYDGPGSGSLRLSIKEAHVLCIGLARGEAAGRKTGQEKAARTVASPSGRPTDSNELGTAESTCRHCGEDIYALRGSWSLDWKHYATGRETCETTVEKDRGMTKTTEESASTPAPAGGGKVLVDLSGVDFAMLRAQKYALDILSAESGHGWAAGVVNVLDDISDKAASILGDRSVFGPLGLGGAYVGVGTCRSCGSAIALDETGPGAVWVDGTGGDVCCGGDGVEDGETAHRL